MKPLNLRGAEKAWDDRCAEHAGYPSALEHLHADPRGVEAVAEQRALRATMNLQGQSLPVAEPTGVEVKDPGLQRLSEMAWIDGVGIGLCAAEDLGFLPDPDQDEQVGLAQLAWGSRTLDERSDRGERFEAICGSFNVPPTALSQAAMTRAARYLRNAPASHKPANEDMRVVIPMVSACVLEAVLIAILTADAVRNGVAPTGQPHPDEQR